MPSRRSAACGIDADGVHYLANCFTVGDRIAEAAQDWGADAIFFGSNRRRRWSRLRGAGLRERVTALTGLPVLTAPAPLKVAGGLHADSLERELAHLVAASARQLIFRLRRRTGRVPAHPMLRSQVGIDERRSGTRPPAR